MAISQEYGSDSAKKIVKSITDAIRGLCDYEEKGPEVSKMFDVVSDYRYIFVSKNYVFYRIEEKYIRIINLYHEKEDFMWQLFGVDTTPQETIDYWNEQNRRFEFQIAFASKLGGATGLNRIVKER